MKEFFSDTEEESDDGGWLTSYADLMTLIACFFILLVAFAHFDPPTFQSKTREVAKHFNKEKYKSQVSKQDQLQEEIERSTHLKNMTSTNSTDNHLEINLTGSFLFERGGYKLKEKMIPIVDSLIEIIKDRDPNYRIIIEGHTDDLPIIGKKTIFTSNWALSGARASSIAERFEYYGFEPKNIKVLGLAATSPQLPHRNKEGEIIVENLKVNRRVAIKVLEPVDKEKSIRMGLGVYFDD